MIILDLCGGTGAWSKPYKEAGYMVLNLTLPEVDVRLFKWDPYINLHIHGILAAPPCAEFSYAKHFHGKGNYAHDYKEGLSIVDACLRMVVLYKPKWWALENPRNYLRKWMGLPKFVFDPWEFGDYYQKKTCIWGEFNIPIPTVAVKPEGLVKFSMLKSKEIYPEYYGKLTRQERRAITPPGFSQAFFEANP